MTLGRRLPREPTAGDSVGGYTLVAAVGRGLMGRVYRARSGTGADVAVKLLEPMLAGDPTARARFAHEVRAARAIRHENVVPIVDDGEHDGRPFLVMPWYPNGSLADELAFTGPLAGPRLATVARDLGAGLGAVHAAGLIHRDMKPANALVGGDGRVVVTDLGLVRGDSYTRLTRPGDVPGTPAYVAPELILGEEASAASDIYALACLLYEAVTGRPPFASERVLELARAHIEAPVPDPLVARGDLPAPVGPALVAGLAKRPEERPASAAAYGAALADLLARAPS